MKMLEEEERELETGIRAEEVEPSGKEKTLGGSAEWRGAWEIVTNTDSVITSEESVMDRERPCKGGRRSGRKEIL